MESLNGEGVHMALDSTIRMGKLLDVTSEDRLEKRVGSVAAAAPLYKERPGGESGRQTTLDEYLSLVRAFPLMSIRDDAHLKEALAAIDVMLDLPNRSEAQETYLSALTDLAETYETAHVVFPPRTGLDALRFLMESNELRQEDLVPIFGTKSIVSEVLNERWERKLTLEHVKKLAAYFHVSPAVFIDDARA
jgi:HTH-type transcriptional regulator/antitoxin HigA